MTYRIRYTFICEIPTVHGNQANYEARYFVRGLIKKVENPNLLIHVDGTIELVYESGSCSWPKGTLVEFDMTLLSSDF